MTDNPLLARVHLRANADAVPKEGLTQEKLRVELKAADETASSWIAELKIIGDRPWRRGENRDVELRIMSDQFKEQVVSKRPKLLVCRGSAIVGDLEFPSA
jgi:hypothetical protein